MTMPIQSYALVLIFSLIWFCIGAFVIYYLYSKREKIKQVIDPETLEGEVLKVGEITLSSSQFNSPELLNYLIKVIGKKNIINYLQVNQKSKSMSYAG